MKSFRSCLYSLAGRLRPVRGKVLVKFFAGTAEVAASLGFVWASKNAVDVATGSQEGSFSRAVWMFVGIMAFQLLCRIFIRYWEGYIEVTTRNDMRRDVFSHVMRSVWTGREKFHSGDTVNRLEQDISLITDFLCVNLPALLVTSVQLVAASVYLFMMQPSLAWVLILIMPAAVLGSMLFFRKMRKITGEIRTLDSRIQGHIQENLQHRVLVLTLRATGKVMEKLGMLQRDVMDKTLVRLNYASVSRAFMSIGFMSGYALAFLWGASGLRDGSVTYGMMVAFLQLVGQIQRPVAEITRHIPAFIRALSSEERLMELLEVGLEDDGEDIVFDGAPGIRVEGLGFSYPGQGRETISGLDHDFAPGSVTVVMGPTGAGKSTLVRLLLALLKPAAGKVEIYDGERSVPAGPRTRCNFMYVPQGNSLMSGTIRENLMLADPKADEGKMLAALHAAVADFVTGLPDGLDSTCSEVGSGLSEGQAQRIAIARSLLRPGGILILDEATSALDEATEQELLSRLSEGYKGSKTIICITHRPAAVSLADSVLKLGEDA